MSYEYEPIKRKFPHPWWHWFFINLVSYGNDGSYENHYCSKCKKTYHLRAKKSEVVEVCND